MKPFFTLKSRMWLPIFIAVVPSMVLATVAYVQERKNAIDDPRHEADIADRLILMGGWRDSLPSQERRAP